MISVHWNNFYILAFVKLYLTNTMTKTDIIKSVTKSSGLDEEVVRDVFNHIVETIKSNLYNGIDVKIHDFMNFTLHIMKARKSQNPKTGEEVIVPKHYKVRPTLSRVFQARIFNKVVY